MMSLLCCTSSCATTEAVIDQKSGEDPTTLVSMSESGPSWSFSSSDHPSSYHPENHECSGTTCTATVLYCAEFKQDEEDLVVIVEDKNNTNTHGSSRIDENDAPQVVSHEPNLLLTPTNEAVSLLIDKLGEQSSSWGYPGTLDAQQTQACRELSQKLTCEQNQTCQQVVHALSSVEDEAFALCRCLRACNFHVDRVFSMLGDYLEQWKEAQANDFYPDCETALGVPEAVLTTQLPIIFSGLSKTGAVVTYVRLGETDMEALEALVMNPEDLSRYWWHRMMHALPAQVRKLRQQMTMKGTNSTAVLCEEFYVIDMKGLSYKQVSRHAIHLLTNMMEPTGCFPELQQKAIIVNAPTFFRIIWGIAKNIMYERTAEKVEVLHDDGHDRLHQLLDSQGIPADYGGGAPSFEEIRQSLHRKE